uniref:alpha-1,2-Mannosidase n=1 Tax=Trichuris muris TaxID=70415 RepID=A0A5S6QUR0_TRIMR
MLISRVAICCSFAQLALRVVHTVECIILSTRFKNIHSFNQGAARLHLMLILVFAVLCAMGWSRHPHQLFLTVSDPWESHFGYFPESLRIEMLSATKDMFYHAYDSYMRYAMPKDELDPINCVGRGPDRSHPENININDVLGDYSLSLIDSLTTLALMGNGSEFRRAVSLIIENVHFAKDSIVQVFEVTIRVIGALLSAHLMIVDPKRLLGDFSMPEYKDELLDLAHDLALRLLPAFQGTNTGLPYPRVSLLHGVPKDTVNLTCTAGAGTLLLEFGVLSRLVNDPTFESFASQANHALWKSRSCTTGLLGNVIDIQTGHWVGMLSGIGAGMDSFYEYLLKAYILFGNKADLEMFSTLYESIKSYLRKGRYSCNSGSGNHPLYVNVDMSDGSFQNSWIDSLQASFSSVQVLYGDLEEAICQHALYYTIWRKYDGLPERFNWQSKSPEVAFYPLRPEFVESTYFLFLATKNPFYLHVGKEIIESIERHAKTSCGYATLHSVVDKSLEDRMESFFLSETTKYLYLLFDLKNPVNVMQEHFIFTTEGHPLPLLPIFRSWNRSSFDKPLPAVCQNQAMSLCETYTKTNASRLQQQTKGTACPEWPLYGRHVLPLRSVYMKGLHDSLEVDYPF